MLHVKGLEDMIPNPNLVHILPYLQARVGMDEDGIGRLRRAVVKGGIEATSFQSIAYGSISDSPAEALASLLEDISALQEGIDIALEILHRRLCLHTDDEAHERNARLISVGRDLLSRKTWLRDFEGRALVAACLAGENGRHAAEKVCANVRTALEEHYIFSGHLNSILKALFETQPFVALDTFFAPPHLDPELFAGSLHIGSPISDVDSAILQEWANRDPAIRYPLLGKCLSMFGKRNAHDERDFSPLFLSMLAAAPDKSRFLGDLTARLHPRSWSGSLSFILGERKALLMKLAESDDQVRAWVADNMSDLDRWIEHERENDRASEESFE